MKDAQATTDEVVVLWITAGLGCDGDSIAITAATRPSLEDLIAGVLPGVPRVRLYNPVLSYEVGDDLLAAFERGAAGALGRFILVVEGSIPDESNHESGVWAGFGTDAESGQPIPTSRWIDRLAPEAWALIAIGTCAAYGGIHAMAGNPTGAMGLGDYLGQDFLSRAGVPLVAVPGCPVQPDAFMETLLYLLRQAAGAAPMIPLDEQHRPRWLFSETAHEGCSRGSYYEQAQFADTPDDPHCIVKLGCWGPVVNCNVGRRGWVDGVGGCASVGGVCIGCTMPGFPDKFMPFLEQPPGSMLSAQAISPYGQSIRTLRRFTQTSLNIEPPWRRPPEPADTATPVTSSEEESQRDE
jgi:hydrogenase small subunit